MNFRRIFLVKCLLLLFPSAKFFTSNRIYVAVNKSALLNVTAAGDVYHATWQKDKIRLLQLKEKTTKYYVKKDECRCKIFPNGTLHIDRVVKEDSGKYTVTIYKKDGKLETEEEIMFIVQDPVPQPILSAQCINKTASVKCEVKQKTKDETISIKLTRDKTTNKQQNTTKVELHRQPPGKFSCVVKNEVSEKMAEKVVNCSDKPDIYLILSIAGGAIFLVIFVILLIYCIRKRKAERLEGDEEERKMQTCQMDSEMVVRELPQPPCNPKQLRVQQRPLPQPQGQQQPQPPRPRPRTQQRTPNHPRERP